ncbi:MAG: hypothetical protein AAB225_05730 [Acidobacteriota bacterium]
MRVTTLLALAAAVCLAADKKPPAGQVANEQVEISATLLPDREAIQKELGSDLGGYFTVIRVTVAPKGGRSLAVLRDDFTLRSDKDGQRCGAFAPSQVAGRGALVISSGGGGGFMAENPGPAWGGIGGRPRRLGGDSTAIGNTGEAGARGTISSGTKEEEDPVLAKLKEKGLPEKETAGPVAGLLFFFLEGKHKPKDLELLYNGGAGKLALRFRQ